MFRVSDLDDRSRQLTTGSAAIAAEYFNIIARRGGSPTMAIYRGGRFVRADRVKV